jgi:hypothetical protein
VIFCPFWSCMFLKILVFWVQNIFFFLHY